MSIISAGNTTTTALTQTADTSGNLVFTTGGANTVALTLSNTQAATFSSNVTVSGSLVSGALTTTGSTGSVNSINTFGFKNRIINGSMQIWQRGTSFTVAASTWTYTADRFAVYCGNSSTTVSQNSSVPSGDAFLYSYKLQRTAGNTGTNNLVVTQIIESLNCYDLSGQSVTFSFWAKTGANYSGGAMTVQVTTGTGSDQGIGSIFGSWTGQAYPVNTTQALTSSWTKYTFTATFGSSVREAAFIFAWGGSGTAGADDSVYFTGVQLEVGSQATSFDFRSIGQELSLCQRYYENFSGVAINTAGIYKDFYFRTTKRTGPSIVNVSISSGSGLTFTAGNLDRCYQEALNSTPANFSAAASCEL